MRLLALLSSGLLLGACWSEADFRQRCEAAQNCQPPVVSDAGSTADAGATNDAGTTDAGATDAGADAGTIDAGTTDAGSTDAGSTDAGFTDAGANDGGLTWSAVATELFGTGNSNSTVDFFLIPVPGPTRALGGVLTQRGSVVCIPASGHVLEYQADGGVVSLGILDGGSGVDLWQGGVLLPDGTVLAFPHSEQLQQPLIISGATFSAVPETLPGFKPVTEGGVITLAGDVLIMPANADRFPVWSANGLGLSTLPLDAGVAPSSNAFFSGALLRASGDRALAVPRTATAVWEVSAQSAQPVAALTGYAGGLLLRDGAALLMPLEPTRQAARVATDGGVSFVGPVTQGYFSAAWSTNGFGYALQTYGSAGKLLTISSAGVVTEAMLPANGTLPDGGSARLDLAVSSTSRFGLTAMPDGRLVSCPYAVDTMLVLRPRVQRTVPLWVMTSPWLDKW